MNASIKFKVNGKILEETQKQYNLMKALPTLEWVINNFMVY